MILKPGVKFGNHIMAILCAMRVVETIYEKHGVEFVITSINDGKHMDRSLHYEDRAFDVRTKNIPFSVQKESIRKEIKTALGNDFDVILESEGTDNEHLHVEHDPK